MQCIAERIGFTEGFINDMLTALFLWEKEKEMVFCNFGYVSI
jgi:hypothetical protein